MSRARLATLALLAFAPLLLAGDDPSQAARAKAMREIAQAVQVQSSDGAKVELVDEPVYRWDDPARRFGDGTVWVYGTSGRPTALLTLSLNQNVQTGVEWLHELAALTDTRFAAESRDGWLWSPSGPGMMFRPIPNAPVPATDEAKRLRQLNEQARRFKAFELFDPSSDGRVQRYELRLLTKPVYRYKDAARGILDGGVYLIAYGRNPEIVLVVEARADGKAAPQWSYGLGRISTAGLHVMLDDQDLAPWPGDEARYGPNRPYHIFGLPARGLNAEK
ncbi:MAG: hypothetical protein P4L84_18530 [Isosphaeraceae bacterium]|nr:hypothetical protein [Isosphaeraceae bacterium]